MKLVLIRHTSVDVEPGVCYGISDVRPAQTFPTEADAVKRKLSKYNFSKVYSSPSSRCTMLAEYCGYDSVIIDSRLMEMNFGEWEMKRYDEITDPRLQDWYKDFINVKATGGESSMDQRERFENFLSELLSTSDKKDTVAIFTHGGILIHAIVTLQGKSYREAFSAHPHYGEILDIDI